MMFNRATIAVASNMGNNPNPPYGKDKYGFSMHVINAQALNFPSDFRNWKIYIADSYNNVVDGTTDTMPMVQNPNEAQPEDQMDKAFGIFQSNFQTIRKLNITVPSPLIPQRLSEQLEWVTLDGWVMPEKIEFATFRLILPYGWQWPDDKDKEYQGWPAGETGRASWPCGTQTVVLFNQLRFVECHYEEGTLYGFSRKALIPDYSPTHSANAFILELGGWGTSLQSGSMRNVPGQGQLSYENVRRMAMMYPAPMVTTIRNGGVTTSSDREGAESVLTIDFRLITPVIQSDDGFLMVGTGANVNFQLFCNTLDRRIT